jgi:hypothetical protein
MRILTAAAAAVAAFTAAGAQAAVTDKSAAACAATTAFGVPYGAAESTLGPSDRVMANSRFINPTGDWAPFSEFEAAVTPVGRRLVSVTGSAKLGRPGTARAKLKSAAAKLAARGLIRSKASVENGAVVYYSEAPGEGEPTTGYKVELFIQGGDLVVRCVDLELQQRQVDEFFGHVRLETAPEPPVLALPPRPAAGACADAKARPALLAAFEQQMGAAMDTLQAMNRYTEQLARWRSRQLVDKHLWTDQQGSDFSKQVLSDPAFMAMTQRSSTAYQAMVAALGRYDAAAKRADSAGQCAAAGESVDSLQQMSNAARTQWAYVNQRFDAEAMRLAPAAE